MKKPTLILRWACDGIACAKDIEAELGDFTFPLTDADFARIAEGGGCRLLGRNTIFCPACADPQRRAPESLR